MSTLKTSCSGSPCGVLCMLADFGPCPVGLVVECQDVALMLDLSFRCALVDAPLIGGVELFNKPFGGEGGQDLLALSPGGRRPHGGSFPFKRDVEGDGIFLRLL